MNLVTYFSSVLAPWVRARVSSKSELGASLVEYALLVALIAIVAIVAIRFLGSSTGDTLSKAGSHVAN